MSPRAKKKFLTPRFLLPAGAVVVLGLSLAFYYLWFLARQEASFDHRAFRYLAGVTLQLQDRVSNYQTVLRRAVSLTNRTRSNIRASRNSDQSNQTANDQSKAISDFLATQVPGLSLAPQPPGQKDCSVPDGSVEVVLKGDSYALRLSSALPKSVTWCADATLNASMQPLLSQSSTLFDDVLLTDVEGRVLFQNGGSEIVASNFSPLLEGVAADEESSASSSSASHSSDSKAANSAEAGAKFSAKSEASHIFGITVAGARYRAYVVPVTLLPHPASDELGDKKGKAQLILCGLLRQGRFHAENSSIPATYLTTISLVVMLVIVGTWPLLKFLTMSLTERIPRRALLYYILSASGTLVLLVMLIIHIRFVSYDPAMDNNLEDLASTINKNLGTELDRALQVMDAIAANPNFQKGSYSPLTDTSGGSSGTRGRAQTVAGKATASQVAMNSVSAPGPISVDLCTSNVQDYDPPNFNTDILARLGMEITPYPYFRRVFEFDDQGYEKKEWTVEHARTPSIRVCDRDYFTAVVRNQLWYLSEKGLGGPRFRVEPLYSRLTGEYLVVIARPDWDPTNSPPRLRVMTMVTPLLSLFSPVLPPDYGFAIVDDSGKVLFHSDAAKNGRENFLSEVGNAADLQTAIATHSRQVLDLEYLGLKHRALASPITAIEQAPWTLIVFSNISVATLPRVERMLLFGGLTGLYFVPIFIFIFVAFELLRRKPLSWLWPTKDRIGVYRHIAVTLALLALVFYALVFSARPDELLLFSILVPVTSLVIFFWKLQLQDNKIEWMAIVAALAAIVTALFRWYVQGARWAAFIPVGLISSCYLFLCLKSVTDFFRRLKWPSLPISYALAAFSLLILLAGLPCIAFFKLSYDFVKYAATEKQQLFTMAALEQRERQVVDQYSNTRFSLEATPFKWDLGKWLFLHHRLDDQELDRYDMVFRDQRAGRVFSPGIKTCSSEEAGESSSEKAGEDSSVHRSQPLLWLASNLPHVSGSVTHELALQPQGPSKWQWCDEGINRVRIEPRYPVRSRMVAQSSPQTTALAKLVDDDPVLTSQTLAYDLNVLQSPAFMVTLMMLGWGVLLVGMFISLQSTLRRLFLLDIEFRDRWPQTGLDEAISGPASLILVGLPCSGKTDLINRWAGKLDIVDCATTGRATVNAPAPAASEGAVGTVKNIFRALGFSPRTPKEVEKIEEPDRNGEVATVALDNFEYRLNEPEARLQKLEILEELLFRQKKKIIIVTTIDPQFYFEPIERGLGDEASGECPQGNEAERWLRVLMHFKHARLAGCSPEPTPAYHRFLWSTCTPSEKLAVYSLARDGWANYKNRRALEHLWNRDLVERDPVLHLASPEFNQFARHAVSSADHKLWAIHTAAGTFDGIRFMFIVLLFGLVGILLVFNQHEVLGYITAGAGAITPVTKLLSESRLTLPGIFKGGGSENA